jgi:hypothetical protein
LNIEVIKMADDRIRELEIMIRLIDIEIILARRREGRQEQALFVFSLGESSMVGNLLGTFFFGGIM